jgi:glycine/D-amino acid oxidase-like deaminating enzyme/nitrite reductase/ring-hydroxylating ferredoxin subunit
MSIRTESIWRATHQLRRFAPLGRDLDIDVVVVGAGITGLTAAVRLAREGRRVAILERDEVAAGETGNTTAHLTEAVDARYRTIRKDFGEDAARRVARSSREAIDWMEALVGRLGLNVGFARVPGYLYTEQQADVDALADELDAAGRAGCAVSWVDDVPLPFTTLGGIRWDRQAQVHATAYAEALVHEALAHGVRFYDRTPVVGIDDGEPCVVNTEHGVVRATDVFVAANVPINNRVLLLTKIAAYRSYALAGEVSEAMPGLFWDTAAPYHYTRTEDIGGRHYLIVGGEDHRTGEDVDTEQHYLRLRSYARDRFGLNEEKFRWSGQIIEPVDGLPYIGLNSASHHVYVATGFSGNGLTFGTLAGMIVSDLLLGRANPYAELYQATRVKPLTSAVEYVAENVGFPAHLVTDRLAPRETDDRAAESLAPGEGAIFTGAEGHVAVCRDRSGALHSVSAVCTHLGCHVAWNQAEQSWDCPCHGSRFSVDGSVINGPAVTVLPPMPASSAATRSRG